MAKRDEGGGMMQYALIGVAIYFGYQYAVGAGMIPDYFGIVGGGPTPAPTPGPGAGTGAGNGNGAGNDAGQGAGSNTPTGGSGGAGGNVKDQVWQAAKSEAESVGGKMHFWQWNFYLPANHAPLDPFQLPDSAWASTTLGRKPIDADEVQSTKLTLDQWWGMVKGPMGLGGYSRGMAGVNHWGQQASLWPGAVQ